MWEPMAPVTGFLDAGDGFATVPVLISAATKEQAHAVDDALRDVFRAYGYGEGSFTDRVEFDGSWKIRFSWKSRVEETKDGRSVDREVLFDLSRDPATIESSSEKRSVQERLKAVLREIRAWIVVGSTFLGAVDAGQDLVDRFRMTFPPPEAIEAPVETPPEPVAVASLSPSIVPVIANAERWPQGVDFLLGYALEDARRRRRFLEPGRKPRPVG